MNNVQRCELSDLIQAWHLVRKNENALRIFAYVDAMLVAEREECAKVCEAVWKDASYISIVRQNELSHGCVECAAAIRARQPKAALAKARRMAPEDEAA